MINAIRPNLIKNSFVTKSVSNTDSDQHGYTFDEILSKLNAYTAWDADRSQDESFFGYVANTNFLQAFRDAADQAKTNQIKAQEFDAFLRTFFHSASRALSKNNTAIFRNLIQVENMQIIFKTAFTTPGRPAVPRLNEWRELVTQYLSLEDSNPEKYQIALRLERENETLREESHSLPYRENMPFLDCILADALQADSNIWNEAIQEIVA